MPMHDPPHPGEHVRGDCLEPLGLTVTEAARALGVSRKTLSQIINGRAGISPEMAVRLSKAFGSTPRHWLQLQMNYDLWHAERQAEGLDVPGVDTDVSRDEILSALREGRAQAHGVGSG